MTTGRAYEFNLDRLLTRVVSIPGMVLPGTVYRYTERDIDVGGINAQGEYFPDGVDWYLHIMDADGLTLPAADSLTVGEDVTIMGAEGYTFTTTLVVYEQGRNAFGQFLPTVIRMELASSAPALPVDPEVTFRLPTGGMSAPTKGHRRCGVGSGTSRAGTRSGLPIPRSLI